MVEMMPQKSPFEINWHLATQKGLLYTLTQAYDLPARKSRNLRISCTYLLFFVKNCHNGS